MFPEYPADIPKGWLAKELALYDRFGIAAADAPYTKIFAEVRGLPDGARLEFVDAWKELCRTHGRESAADLFD